MLANKGENHRPPGAHPFRARDFLTFDQTVHRGDRQRCGERRLAYADTSAPSS